MASIRCGECKRTHASVAEVRECYARAEWEAAEAAAEAAAEIAYERWLENGGPHADRIAWEHAEDERRAFPF